MSTVESVLEMMVQGPAQSPNPSDRSSTPKDRTPESERANLVHELFARAREARRPLMPTWKRNYRALNNRQYTPGAHPWEEEPAVSQIWPVIASATAWMTDQRPTVTVMPTTESFSEYWDFYDRLTRDMNTVLEAIFSNYRLDGEIAKALWDVHTYGIAYFKTTWEAWLADGLGDTAFRRIDPWTVYPDPHARSEAEARYWVEARTMTVDDADRAWPGAAAKLRDATFIQQVDESPHKLDERVSAHQPRVALGAISPATTPSYARGSADSPNRQRDTPVVTILECWVRGHATTPSSEDPDITHVTDEWRCLVVCGDRVLMDDRASNINGFNIHPYDRLVLFDTGEWYGPCIVELLYPIQRMINWILWSINRNIYLMGNPVLTEGPRAASRNRRYTNRPGQRLEAQPGEVAWLNPPQIHPQMSVDLVRYYEGKIETISGLSAMVRGFSPGGRNSEGVLDSVQDAAFVRVRASLRELERTLKGVAGKMVANVAEFYLEERLQSIIGPSGIQTFLALQARHFYVREEGNPDGRVPLRFSVAADAGSQLPTSKQARASEAKHLFTIGAIDVLELLKAVQWPSYATVAQRVMEQQAQGMAQEKQRKRS